MTYISSYKLISHLEFMYDTSRTFKETFLIRKSELFPNYEISSQYVHSLVSIYNFMYICMLELISRLTHFSS